MVSRYHHISLALPALAEKDNIPNLLGILRRQTFQDFTLYVCVNQPDDWWTLPLNDWRRQVCDDNQNTLRLLNSVTDLSIITIDCSSKGMGWTHHRQGVGWARKSIFDAIISHSDNNELIVSLDADTLMSEDYLATLLQLMNAHPQAAAVSLPYYHPLTDSEDTNRALLRYECYMRHYLLQLLRISNPYAFTALGSAMAFPLWAYQRAGGISPLQGGEDFYLMQKFAKTGKILLPADPRLCVYPQGRVSSRVPFGTGPAIALGVAELSQRYPFYSAKAFDEVRDTYTMFPELYEHDVETPMSDFLRLQLKTDNLWSPLRRNFKRQDLFVHACQERVDGLRILQYLRTRPYPQETPFFENAEVDFQNDSINRLDTYRNHLFQQELSFRDSCN